MDQLVRIVGLADAPPPRWVALDPEQACLVEIDERGESDNALHARLDPATAPAPPT